MIRSSVSEALLHSEGEEAHSTRGSNWKWLQTQMGDMIWTLFKRTGSLDTRCAKGQGASKTFSKTRARDDTKCSELSGEI